MGVREREESRAGRFGAFSGVFVPSVLTILGVIMFMRAGFVVGRAGVIDALLILLVSKAITLCTALSVCAVSTNTRVGGGGAYFLISRVLGPELGGAIGIALYLAQSFSVPFYVLGFCEALSSTFPGLEAWFAASCFVTLAAVFVVSFVGAEWAVRAQYLIFGVLAASIAVFLGGCWSSFEPSFLRANLEPAYGSSGGFWSVFAVYFPAVTGIMTGVNMSGDLQDPATAIPKGTLWAIGVSGAMYLLQLVLMGGAATRAELLAGGYEVLVSRALFSAGWLVAAGVFAATLSSALGSFLTAPRVLQAVARDRILPGIRWLGRGSGENDEPRMAYWLTLLISTLVLVWALGSGKGGGLDLVASVITMFFLATYAMINVACLVETIGHNPSFRPAFRYFSWHTALMGTVGCAAAAFLIDWKAAVAAVVLVGMLLWYLQRRSLVMSFGDSRRGFFFALLRWILWRLSSCPLHPKNWRPTLMVLTGNPSSRPALVELARWMAHERGFIYVANVLCGSLDELLPRRSAARELLASFLERTLPGALPVVHVAPSFEAGFRALLQPQVEAMRPNLVMMGWSFDPSRAISYGSCVRLAERMGLSVVLAAVDPDSPGGVGCGGRIDVWWRGRENGSLMCILAHLVLTSTSWRRRGGRIRILRKVETEDAKVPAERDLAGLVEAGRIDADVEVVVDGRPFDDVLRRYSSDAGLVLLGLALPQESDEKSWHARMCAMLSGMPAVLLIHSDGEADLMA